MKNNASKHYLRFNLMDLEKQRISTQAMAHSLAGEIKDNLPSICDCEHYMGEDETTMQFVR